MDALLHQFFNFDIMARALPLVLQGLQQTILLCLIVIPLGLIGGLIFATCATLIFVPVRAAMFSASLGRASTAAVPNEPSSSIVA